MSGTTFISSRELLKERGSVHSECQKRRIPPFTLARADDVPNKKEEKSLFDLVQEEAVLAAPLLFPIHSEAPSFEVSSGIAHVEIVIEQVVGQMTSLHENGDTETSFSLDAPEFASSPFYGTKIIIKEFSTAPKAFNVEILTTSQALQVLHAHKMHFLEAFCGKKLPFSIERLDIALSTEEEFLFQRKDPASLNDEKEEPRG